MSMWIPRLAADGQPIATRLRRLIFALWALLALMSVVTIAALQAQTDELERLTLVIAPVYDANGDALQAMTDAQAGLLGYQATRDVALLAPYRGAADRTTAALRNVRETLAQANSFDPDLALNAPLVSKQETAATGWWEYARRTEQAVVDGKSPAFHDGMVLFEGFRAANSELGSHIRLERERSRDSAHENATRQTIIVIGTCLVAMLLGLLGGQRAARSFSRPIAELRSVLRRQREGDQSARARVDHGALEVRSLAEDFNALTEVNLGLQQIQAHDLSMNNLSFEIARAIRASSGTQEALDVVCAALGNGLGVDRVLASTFDAGGKTLLGAQWHLPDLPALGGMSADLVARLARLAYEVWLSEGFHLRDDFLAPGVEPSARARTFRHETGARAAITTPIGLGDRVIGLIHVITVHEPRGWTESEANTVAQVAGFVARAIVQADSQAQQSEYVERLVGLDRQKTDFLATVSHELRTPLTSISGYLEMLQDRDAGELTGEQARMLEVMDRNTSRLGGLIEDLLVLNRIESDDLKVEPVLVSLRELITHAVHELAPFARRGSVELDIDAGPAAAIVQGDKGSLDRAVINVVSNAIKFSPPGSVVTIRCALDPGVRRVLISCQDRGIGIPAADQRHLFTRFYRASNATAQAIPGTGLGLSIVKQIVEDHGGELRLSSVEGDGTEVVMDLPLSVRAPLPQGGNDSHSEGVFGIRA